MIFNLDLRDIKTFIVVRSDLIYVFDNNESVMDRSIYLSHRYPKKVIYMKSKNFSTKTEWWIANETEIDNILIKMYKCKN